MKSTTAQRRFLLLAASSALLAISSASPATYYWDVNGNGTDNGFSTVVGTWNTTNNFWNTEATGGTGGSVTNTTDATMDLIIAPATINTGSITVSGTQNASSITFAPNVGPTTNITTNTIVIGGTGTYSGVRQQSSGANTISTALTLNAANTAFEFSNSSSGLLTINAVTGAAASGTQTVTVGSSDSGDITLSGIIGNGGAGGNVALNINSAGAGVTTFSNNNTFNGGLTLTAGTLRANGNAGALGAGTLTLNGGILDFNHSAGLAFNRNTTVGANTTIISNRSVAAQAGVNYTLGTLGIGANTLSVQGGSNVTSGTAGVIFGNTTLSGDAIFDVQNPSGGGGTTLTLASITGAANTLTKNGGGVLAITGASSGSGTYTVNGGVLRANNATSLPGGTANTGGTSALTLNGGVYEIGSVTTFARNLGTGVTQFQITGGESGFSAFGGARTVTVNNSAATVVQWGSTSFAPTTFVLNAATADSSLAFTNRLDLNGDGVATTRNVAVRANTATMSGIIENLGGSPIGLTKSGAGTLILSNAANSYNGGTTVSGGTLTFNASGALPSGSNLVLNGGTLHNSGVVTQTAGTLTLTANSTIAQLGTGTVPSGGGSLRFSGAVGDWTGLNLSLTGPLGPTSLRFGTDATGLSAAQLARITHTLVSGATKTVTINGSGYVTSGSSDGYRGGTGNWSNSGTWDGGMIAFGEDATATIWGTAGSGATVTVDAPITIGHIYKSSNKNHTINSSGGNILTLAVSSGMPTLGGDTTTTLTISATLAGDDGLEVINGYGVLLSGDNIYTGGTKLTGGTLRVGHANALGGDGSGTIALNGGTIQSSDATARSFGNAVTIGGNFTVGGTANMTFSNTGASALGATRTITVSDAAVTAAFAQAFSGTAGITKAGAGTLVLSGASTFDGGIAIQAGILEINSIGSVNGSASSLGIPTNATNGKIYFSSGAKLVYTGGTATTDRQLATGGVTSTFTVDQSGTGLLKFTTAIIPGSNGGLITMVLQGSTAGTGEFSGAINNTNSGRLTAITKAGTGTWTLSGTNGYTGATTINAGTLALGANNVLAVTAVSIGNGVFDVASFDDTVGTLDVTAATSTINLGSGANLAFAASNAVDWAGGTLNLTGALDFSGTATSSLRFGTSSSGLAAGQLLQISSPGWTNFALNADGYLTAEVDGGGAPEIAVDQGGNIETGGSKTFGTVTIGSPTTLVFTINNTGTAALNLTGTPRVAVSGDADFTVTVQPAASVAASSNTSFTVQFAPGASGVRNAQLSIANNDSSGSENPFIINLSGTGQTPYEAWAGGTAFDGDANGDGVKNGLAFLLGASGPNVSALDKLPTATQSGGNLVLNFNSLPVAARGGATLKVAHSSDVGILDPWTATVDVVPDADDAIPDNDVTFEVGTGPVGPPALNTVTATIDASAAANGKLFGRLEAKP